MRNGATGQETERKMDAAWSNAHADFMSSLSDAETDSLMQLSKRISLKKRDLLFEAGDPSRTAFIVAEGCIKLYQLSPSGKEIILWFSFPGEVFGVAELLQGAEREIFAEANVDSKVYCISQKNFLDFLRTHPEAAMRAIGILSARVRTLGSTLVDLATDDVQTRLARFLLRYAAIKTYRPCTNSLTDDEICVNIPFTHQDIANLIGASRQTVTSTLAGLRRRGAISNIDRHIHIVEPKQLRRLLDPAGF